ncbi:tetraspanin-14 isoform X2 [Phyllopteryx taeniolatus]|uniref:tetraspanin-14 isoform X2 n=1 Tax=Phyllopteryx taeniolatus TaxID=161469 RepID=UPI002AD22095|nr:tetraspanin-14 isoform X2 [Phyllopteryx taeniolatus]
MIGSSLHGESGGCPMDRSRKRLRNATRARRAAASMQVLGMWEEGGCAGKRANTTRESGNPDSNPRPRSREADVPLKCIRFKQSKRFQYANVICVRCGQFSGMIGLIFFVELAVAVLAVVFQSQVREWINGFFLANVKAYRDDIDLQNLIDSLQRTNHCCGAQEPDDWDVNVYFSCKGTHQSREKCGVPFSCCVADPADSVLNTQCGYDVRNKDKAEWPDHIHVKGCIAALEDWLPANLYTLATVFVVISLLQVVGIYLARSLISDIQKVRLSY